MSRLKKIANFVFAKSIYRVVEYNKPELSDDTYILAPNHVSDADGPTVWGINENIRIMAKKECFERKIVGKILTAAGVVSVDRDKKNGTEIRDAIRYLSKDENCLFMMFPQGTISDINKNKLARIKTGTFYLSASTGKKIVPMFIEQPRPFRKARIVYASREDFISVEDIYNEAGRVDREKVEPYKQLWMDKVLMLQDMAVEKGKGRPIRKLKLKEKHRNNNEG